jgi:cell division protein FtsQ
MLRLRKLSTAASIIALAGATIFAGYHNGAFRKIGGWASSETLKITADAGFKVKDILVTGRKQISEDALLASLSVKQNAPIFGISIADAQKSLSGISWVKDVTISRRLPDAIIVELKERQPAALWQYQKKISLIDQEGAVLTAENLSPWKSLPLVVGEDAPKHIAELAGLLNAEPVIAGALGSAVRINNRRWDLHLQNGMVVKLPEQDSELALRRLVTLQAQKKIFDRNIAAIDLRQPERLMVTPIALKEDVTPKNNKKTSL